MNEEPRILKKIEELSNEISDFVINPRNSDKPIEVTPVDIKQADQMMLFKPDFSVIIYCKNKEVLGCACHYGGERILCNNDIIIPSDIWGEGDDAKKRSLGYSLFPDCIIRQYARIFLYGMDKLKEKKAEEKK